jgi:MraZ protein
VVFVGTYEHAIDNKNRVAIPAEVRTQLLRQTQRDAQSHGKGHDEDSQAIALYVTLGEGQALCLYTEQGFEQRAAELDHSELEAEQILTYERLFFSLAARVELDKAGRIRLPENLIQRAGLQTEVVLIGVKDHLEIMDRQRWQAHVEAVLTTQPGVLMNPRRAMKKTGS